MSITADQITIAITVYNRRDYLHQAIRSALDQTVPVRVMVVEDCGPDAGLETFVKEEFGTKVEYFRNPQRRGLFGNWNACMEYCRTPWLSICHDDDYLAPNFVEAMLKLNTYAPNCGLYFGQTSMVDEAGVIMPGYANPEAAHLSPLMGPMNVEWRRVHLEQVLFVTPFPFPGQLFRVDCARTLGGFREGSVYTGDWEMWTKLIAHYGAAQIGKEVASNRTHFAFDRGTSQVIRAGKVFPSTYLQRKRNLALMRQLGKPIKFNRRENQLRCPMSNMFLIRFGAGLSPRLLRYNVGLMLLSRPPHWRYAVFQAAVRVLGWRSVRWLSRAWNFFAACRWSRTDPLPSRERLPGPRL